MTKLLLVMVVLGFSGSAFAEGVGVDAKINCADVVKAAKVKSKSSEAKADDKEKSADETKAAKTE